MKCLGETYDPAIEKLKAGTFVKMRELEVIEVTHYTDKLFRIKLERPETLDSLLVNLL